MLRIVLRTHDRPCLDRRPRRIGRRRGEGVPPATADHRARKSILGAKVSLRGGTSAGTVEDIVLSNEGVVDYLVVSSGGKYVTVPWDAAKFDHGKRIATIDLTQEQYQKIPTYTAKPIRITTAPLTAPRRINTTA